MDPAVIFYHNIFSVKEEQSEKCAKGFSPLLTDFTRVWCGTLWHALTHHRVVAHMFSHCYHLVPLVKRKYLKEPFLSILVYSI